MFGDDEFFALAAERGFINRDEAPDYVRRHYLPHEIFSEEILEDWARDTNFIHEDEALEYVASRYEPGDVFEEKDLREWLSS